MQGWRLCAVLCAAFAAVTQAGAAEQAIAWLDGHEIASALAGKTLEGRYASGRAFTERYGPDGSIAYMEGGRTLGGHWSVTAGTLCTIYDTDPTGGCFRVSRVSDNCFEFYFTARTEVAAPGPNGAKPHWTARGSVSGQASACQDGASV